MSGKEQRLEALADVIRGQAQKIDALVSENEELRERIEWDIRWTGMREVSGDGLPTPRLELRAIESEDRWEYKWLYSLVYEHLLDHCVGVPLGMTRVGGEHGPDIKNEPFRESAHIRADMKTLLLPGFVVVGSDVASINSENRDQVPYKRVKDD